MVLGNASFFLELRFAIVSAQEESLAPRSDQKYFGLFLSVFGHFFRVLWVFASARGVRCVDWESGLGIGDSGFGLGMGIAFGTWAW